ncbi:hypothetical protein SNEBB_007423 [Seison nebaliae]|nr:hypothetical protein SNEBB_007423 [Seison nebaliae]
MASRWTKTTTTLPQTTLAVRHSFFNGYLAVLVGTSVAIIILLILIGCYIAFKTRRNRISEPQHNAEISANTKTGHHKNSKIVYIIDNTIAEFAPLE